MEQQEPRLHNACARMNERNSENDKSVLGC
jgi:hypothetical protein